LLNGGEEISNIGLILGAKSAYCIPERSVSFGGPNQSIYLDSPIGVMIFGHVSDILSNKNTLPNCEKLEVCQTSTSVSSLEQAPSDKKVVLTRNSELQSCIERSLTSDAAA
jgi:hypothetical protein